MCVPGAARFGKPQRWQAQDQIAGNDQRRRHCQQRQPRLPRSATIAHSGGSTMADSFRQQREQCQQRED
jgi:hypothetical protein